MHKIESFSFHVFFFFHPQKYKKSIVMKCKESSQVLFFVNAEKRQCRPEAMLSMNDDRE